MFTSRSGSNSVAHSSTLNGYNFLLPDISPIKGNPHLYTMSIDDAVKLKYPYSFAGYDLSSEENLSAIKFNVIKGVKYFLYFE